MPLKQVYLFPGFTASDLVVFATRDLLWWDFNLVSSRGIGGLRLAPDGIHPGPPDGLEMGTAADPQAPWGLIELALRAQFDPSEWLIRAAPYDWRVDIDLQAPLYANQIRQECTVENPGTIVGHSMGGLLACRIWANLLATGQQTLIRRIITICSPFQGSYYPILWLNGSSGTIRELTQMATFATFIPVIVPLQWQLAFLNGIAVTWPAFYELLPSLIGSEAEVDPHRINFYTAANYPPDARPSQTWLDYAKLIWQPKMAAMDTYPPPWVFTCVVSTGIATPFRLGFGSIPMQLEQLGVTSEGDGVVTTASMTRGPAAIVTISAEHASAPLGITLNGVLAQLIRDPRVAPSPPPPPVEVVPAIAQNVTDPPQSEPVTGLVCVGGG